MSIGKISISAVLAIALTASAQAQQAVATLANVQGTVLVSRAEGLAAATAGQALAAGTRIIATHNSRAVVHYAIGCDVVLPESSRATVGRETSCAALQAGVVALPVAGAIGASAAGAASMSTATAFVGSAGVAAAAGGVGYGGYRALVKDRENSATSSK